MSLHRPLHEWNSHQRLGTGQKYASGFPAVAIVEFVVIEGKSHPRSVAEIRWIEMPIIPDQA